MVQDSLVVEDGKMVQFPLVPTPLAITVAITSQDSPAFVNSKK